jgi:hypothetical protein
MFTKTKIALCVAIVHGGVASSALASNDNDGGNETGGFVIPGSMDGVNPVYHPELFGRSTKTFDAAKVFDSVSRPIQVQVHTPRKKTPQR